MKNINTRTLQDILRAEQTRLTNTKHPLQRGVVMRRIQNISTELLYRWRQETQTVGA
jgi:hypothetical protein